MCGIVGFIGKKNAKDFVISGLKKLEYRGYDSWGIGLKERGKIKVIKDSGKIGKIKSNNIKSNAHIAIGHTRWATHGAVTKNNAHPHTDCFSNIAVVHNGIINNHQDIRKKLIRMGHNFSSDTDTEVIPHIVEEYLKKTSTKESLRLALNDLKGDYAICLISAQEEKIYLAVNGCPLAIGLGKNEKYISSDMIAFIEKTQEVIFLKDNMLAEISDEINIFDIKNGKQKKFIVEKVSLDQHQASKGGFKHFLFKEINDQPEILNKICKMDDREIKINTTFLRGSPDIFFTACGTAYHAALVGEYLFAKLAKIHVNTSIASEFPVYCGFMTDKTLLFAISQSGETADVLGAVKSAKNKKAKIFSLVNNPNSTLVRLSDVIMITPAGREIAVLSTKAFTSQIAVLYLLSSAVAGKLKAARQAIAAATLAVRESLRQININKIKILTRRIKNSKDIFTIGRGLNYPTALEAALKIKEVSYIHAEGFAGGELKHGTIALIEKNVPCVVFVSEDEYKDEILSNAQEIKARGGYIIGVSPFNNEIFDYWIQVANIPAISPILNIIPIQVLAYFLALAKGLDPDKPRNLAKSVTVK